MPSNHLKISNEDLEKVNRTRSRNEAVKIDAEQLFIAEFGKHYGWDGVQAILNNEIDGETATWLLQAARKVDMGYVYRNAQATLIGSGAAQSKKPKQVFDKATKDILKQAKADII